MILICVMGFENDDIQNLDQPAVANQEVPMKPKITYARDFLMSLSELYLCKQLPNGFDKLILNEFHDAFHGSQEKTRTSGCFATNFRRTKYSASPLIRQDVNSYCGGSTGKWESRSRDGDSQTDRDSDSRRQNGNHSRRPWQNSEHDGLLGSGSSPQLTGCTSGTKFRSNDQSNHNRSNAPYQPPRPYKAVPHGQIATNDLHNDETFGSAEITSEDQAEEERKRRAEFELMRKERHKSGQEKQYLTSLDSKDDLIFDATDHQGILCGEKKISSKGNQSPESSAILAQQNGSIKSSTYMHTSASRPVVPPGFVPPRFGDTNRVAKPAVKHDIKLQTSEIDNILVISTANLSTERNSDVKIVKQPDDSSHRDQSNQSAIVELLVNGEGLDSKMGVLQSNVVASNQNFAALFLEDVFGNSLTTGSGLSKLTELPYSNLHDKWKGSTVGSSKFAHWFVEGDGTRQEDCQLSGKSTNLFSVIGGGPTSERNSDDGKAKAAEANGTSVPVLTCEDLELSILSELSHHNVPSSETLQQGSVSHDTNIAQPKTGTYTLASQHLLSVLQKGPAPNDGALSLDINKGSSNQHHLFESSSMGIATESLKQRKVDNTSHMGNNPTLEALFGSAFMKELHAIDAPISTKDSLISDSSRFYQPEDENLITASDPLNPSKSFSGHVDTSINAGNASSYLPVGNTDRLGALSFMFRDGKSGQANAFLHNPYEKMEHSSAYHNIPPRSSPPQFPPPHMNQGRPMFNQSDSHRQLPQMRFPDNMIHHDQQLTHQFSLSRQMFHQPRSMGFDPASQQPTMQQVHMQSNVPLPHLLRQYSAKLPQSSRPYNQLHGFRQELDPMQGFCAGHQQPGFGGLGMSPPVSDLSNHHPDTVQRLMEMELRSRAKQKYPFPAAPGHLGGQPNFEVSPSRESY